MKIVSFNPNGVFLNIKITYTSRAHCKPSSSFVFAGLLLKNNINKKYIKLSEKENFVVALFLLKIL